MQAAVKYANADKPELFRVIGSLAAEIEYLREQIRILRNEKFGRKSERIDSDCIQLLLPGLEPKPDAPAEPPAETKVAAHVRIKGHGRKPFAEHLQRIRVNLDLDDADRFCSECNSPLNPMGECITERGHIVPATMVVMSYHRKKFGCPKGHGVKMPPLPPTLIDKSKYEISVFANIAASKYCDHVPLNRAQGIYGRRGFDISRQSMWEMLRRVDEIAARPVLGQMRKELLESNCLASDATTIKTRMEGGGKPASGQIFGYRDLVKDRTLFEFHLSRGHACPRRFLENWKGHLLADGANDYDGVERDNGIRRYGCWSHARRYFVKAFESGCIPARGIILLIRRLFNAEAAILNRTRHRGLTEPERLQLAAAVRAKTSRRIMDRIFTAAENLRLQPETLPRSQLGKAIAYLQSQEERLRACLENPRIPIHNNDMERDLRHIVVGRKNWMVFGSPRGGEVAARLFSLMYSCKAMGIDPEEYLRDILQRVSTTPQSDIASLTPWAWAAAKAAKAD